MYIYIYKYTYFQMVCQKLWQNTVSGWGSLEESDFTGDFFPDLLASPSGKFLRYGGGRQVQTSTLGACGGVGRCGLNQESMGCIWDIYIYI